MEYLGWDIGIKNLAFCLLKDNSNDTTNDTTQKNVLEIKNWGIIDLQKITEQVEQVDNNVFYLSSRPKIKCKCQQSKTGKSCNKKVVSVFKNNLSEGVCTVHSRKYSPTSLYKVDKAPICSFVSEPKTSKSKPKKCTKNSTYVRKNNSYIGYCTQHYNKMNKEYQKNESDLVNPTTLYSKLVKKKKANKISLISLGQTMFNELDKHPEFMNASYIIIENQPVLKNPTMKSVQMLLYSYFILRGFCEREKTNSKIKHINLFQAKQKLNAFTEKHENLSSEDRTKILKIEKLKSKYSRTKQLSIIYCRHMIKEQRRWIGLFVRSKKKDDLADAYLTTVHYIQKNNPMFLKKKPNSKDKKDKQSKQDKQDKKGKQSMLIKKKYRKKKKILKISKISEIQNRIEYQNEIQEQIQDQMSRSSDIADLLMGMK